MSRMFGSRLRLVVVLTFGGGTLGCESPQGSPEAPAISEACLDRIARDALNNPRTNSLAANFAGPLGLVPSSDPDAAPYLSRQVEFRTADGAAHYFAIGSARAPKAVMIRLVETETEPTMRLFVMARDGTLLAAGRIDNRRLSVLDLSDSAVLSDARAEQSLWTAMGPAIPCRRRQ